MKYTPNFYFIRITCFVIMVGLGNAFVYSNFKGPIYLRTAVRKSSRGMSRRLSSSITKLRRSSLLRKPPDSLEEYANAVDDSASDRLAQRMENEDKI